MRAGGCTLQQALTPEATTVVMQAVSLARRRGHAQVTPLHVASTMLSSTTGLLRAACLQSHSHPLQCKALELCFNVALNRLPASTTSTPMLNPHQNHHHHHPSLSNALVAAFKRAQAHQRRGSIESQQQPLLAIKIEIEQLIISILDDPSVSRVMREAGFSSTQVKTNVEHALSLDMCSPSPSSSSSSSAAAAAAVAAANSRKSKQESFPTPPHPCAKNAAPAEQIKTEDVMSVMDCLTNKKRRKRSVVVVGECLATVEGVVRGVMDKAERGEGPELLRNVQFINLPIFSFSHLSKEEVEHKVAELRCLVKSCCMGRGAVLYLGDLRWAAEYRTSCTAEKGRNYYCPVEHVIMEVGRLASWRMEGGEYASQGRFWIMGVATYQTYNKCRNGHPSLETLWSLHPLTIPAGSLELSLSCESDLKNPLTSHGNVDGGDCGSLASNLPSWLQQYKGDKRVSCPNDQGVSRTRDICERWKWNSICGSSGYKLSNHNHSHSHSHQPLLQEKTLNFSLVSSASISSSHDQACPSWKVHHFLTSDSPSDEGEDRRNPKSTSPNPKPDAVNSTTSSDTMEMEHHRRFKELNAENHKILCNALEEKVPWQMDVIPAITSTILQCRSGMTRRKDKSSSSIKAKEDTWLLFQGCDSDGKETVSRELAALIFGSNSNIAMIGLNDFAQTRGDSTDAASSRCKRSRSEMGLSYLDRFVEAVKRNPHRVFLLDDVQQLDPRSCLAIKGAVERGTIRGSDGEEVQIEDAIVVLSCETLDARSRACSPQVRQRQDYDREKEASECEKDGSSSLSLDLNLSAEGQEEEEDEVEQCNRLAESVDRTFFFNVRTQT